MYVCVYLLTSPNDQDVIQGQFLSTEFNRFEFSFLSLTPVAIPRLKSLLCPLFTHSWRENNWIYTFLKSISAI